MYTDHYLTCERCSDGKLYCECQRAGSLPNSRSRNLEPTSSPTISSSTSLPASKWKGRDTPDIRAWTTRTLEGSRLSSPNVRVIGNRSPAVNTAPMMHDSCNRRAPNIVRAARPAPPSLTISQPDLSTGSPSWTAPSSQDLLTTISLSQLSPSGTLKDDEASSSWPVISSLSSALMASRLRRNSSLTPSERRSGSFSDLQYQHETRNRQLHGASNPLQRRASSATFSLNSSQSSSSTLVDHGLNIPGFYPSNGKLKDPAEQSLPPMANGVRASPLSSTGSGFFDQSHHFAVTNSTMYSIGTQHTHYCSPYTVLERYTQYIMPGAELDTKLREYPPRCHPGTRTEIIAPIRSSLRDSRQAGMVWVSGPAGAGKSAVMQTLAEAESGQDGLLAALFLSKKDEVNDARRVLPTIAYQLAVRSPAYRSFLEECSRTDPMFLEKSLKAQFQNLIVAPFVQNRVPLSLQPCVIFVDALEECQDERDQCKILELVHDFTTKHPAIPITWIFATRQQPHLKALFTRFKRTHNSYQDYHLSIKAEEARRDVQRYLVDEFNRIKASFPDIIPAYLSWPTKDQLRKIASASEGFFAFASSVIDFIGKPAGDPITRLSCVLAFLDDSFRLKATTQSSNPFTTLDMLYSRVMSEVPSDMLPRLQLLLGYYTPPLVAIHGKNSFLLACNILGLERNLECTLRTLSSILTLPLPPNMHIEGLRFLHSSFGDYLCDLNRSSKYWIDSSVVLTQLWRCYARILLQWLKNRSQDDIRLSWVQTPTSRHETGYDLRHEMFGQASSLLTVLLPQYGHHWCPASCLLKSDVPFLLSLSPSEVFDVLQQLDYGSPTCLSSDPIDMLKFFMWIQGHTPVDFRSKLVLQEFRLSKMDKPRLFKALCEQKWYRGIIERQQKFDTEVDGPGIHCVRHLDASKWVTAETMLAKLDGYLGDLVRLLQEGDITARAVVTVFVRPSTTSFRTQSQDYTVQV